MKRSSCAAGQGIGALVVERVHRGNGDEGRLELVRRALDRDLPLLHDLEQRGLRLGGGAVDSRRRAARFVKTGPGWKRKVFERMSKTFEPETSIGKRSGVNWMRFELAVDARREGLREHGLADAGDITEEDVTLGRDRPRGVRAITIVLAHDDLADVRGDLVELLRDLRVDRLGPRPASRCCSWRQWLSWNCSSELSIRANCGGGMKRSVSSVISHGRRTRQCSRSSSELSSPRGGSQ